MPDICPQCGKPVRPSAKFCNSCGANLGVIPSQPAPLPPESATGGPPPSQEGAQISSEPGSIAAPLASCPYCGKPVRIGVRFCISCGHELAPLAGAAPITPPPGTVTPPPAAWPTQLAEPTAGAEIPPPPAWTGTAVTSKPQRKSRVLWLAIGIVALFLVLAAVFVAWKDPFEWFGGSTPKETEAEQAQVNTQVPSETAMPTLTSTPESIALLRVTKDGKSGYIDTLGNIKIPLQYDGAGPFSEGLAAVKQGEKWGYINSAGEMVISPSFSDAYTFHDGRAMFQENDKNGFIDTSGTVIVPAEYDDASNYSEEIAKVLRCTEEKPCTWITFTFESGKITFPSGGDQYFIDLNGKPLLAPPLPYTSVQSFQEGLAGVSQDNKYGFIDKTGKLVIPMQFDYAAGFSEGLARIKQGDNYGFINNSGAIVIQPQYKSAGDFSEGLARIQQGDKYGFIDQNGSIVIPIQFDNAGSFSEGFAYIKQGDKYGYIDMKGTIVIQPQFADAGDFESGVAAVWDEKGGVMSYINIKGEYIWPSP